MNPIPPKLPNLEPLYTAVGRGISAFASVEFGVGVCFASMLAPAPRKAGIAAIHSARSFEAKMKMVDATAAASLTGKKLEKWRSISCKITKRKDMRDKLAHWMVSRYPGIATLGDIRKLRAALVPPFWSKQHMEVMWDPKTNRKAKPIFLNQIEEFCEKTDDLFVELSNFSKMLTKSAAKK